MIQKKMFVVIIVFLILVQVKGHLKTFIHFILSRTSFLISVHIFPLLFTSFFRTLSQLPLCLPPDLGIPVQCLPCDTITLLSECMAFPIPSSPPISSIPALFSTIPLRCRPYLSLLSLGVSLDALLLIKTWIRLIQACDATQVSLSYNKTILTFVVFTSKLLLLSSTACSVLQIIPVSFLFLLLFLQ